VAYANFLQTAALEVGVSFAGRHLLTDLPAIGAYEWQSGPIRAGL